MFEPGQSKKELRYDLRLFMRSIKDGWPVTFDMMARCVERVYSVVDEEPDSKLAMDAVKVFVAMNKQNMELENDGKLSCANVIETTSGNLEDQRSELLRRIAEARERGRDAGADGSGAVIDVVARSEREP